MIDPKRLTEKDRGREVVFPEFVGGDRLLYGAISGWNERIVIVKCYCHGALCNPLPETLNFLSGTYQDGGAE